MCYINSLPRQFYHLWLEEGQTNKLPVKQRCFQSTPIFTKINWPNDVSAMQSNHELKENNLFILTPLISSAFGNCRQDRNSPTYSKLIIGESILIISLMKMYLLNTIHATANNLLACTYNQMISLLSDQYHDRQIRLPMIVIGHKHPDLSFPKSLYLLQVKSKNCIGLREYAIQHTNWHIRVFQ